MKKLYFGLLLAAMFATSQALACSCHPIPDNAVEAYKRADAVFVGKVKEVYPAQAGGAYKFLFSVDNFWKGQPSDTIIISTNKSGVSCGIGLVNIGEEHLFYASKKLGNEHYTVTMCDRHLIKKDADTDVRTLDSMKK